MTRIYLDRSFSVPSEEREDADELFHYLHKGRGQYYWSDLYKNRVVVVLGEAGIGKTLEFQNEVERLQRDGKPAFFIPLTQLFDRESWELTLAPWRSQFNNWISSDDDGYFFLDAIDEARLTSHAAFERALMVAGAALAPYLARVRVAISSRVTDWAVESVREAVKRRLTAPISDAVSVAHVRDVDDLGLADAAPEQPVAERIDALVVSLDPLSRREAEKLADAFEVKDRASFWAAIEDGDYEFMATRPLDLRWMVNLWNERNGLGTYLQLIDANVRNRLKEVNASHQQAGASPSLDTLRSGAEQLAAAAEFSGRRFLSTTEDVAPNELATGTLLSNWRPVEIVRLLGSAVFDEATFGRVKFHHRSSREYLAASWANQQLKLGIPFSLILGLFTSKVFGITVLIPSRRATFCWLAALNIEVREWMAREFPEMLLFEGDPESWDAITADLAFSAYLERIKKGLQTDWWNSESEFRRLARRLPPGRVAKILSDQKLGSRATIALLPLIKHGHLHDCAQAIFDIYKNEQLSLRERRLALITLDAVASHDHRVAIKEDLIQGRLQTNELIAAALPAADWTTLTVADLVEIFRAAQPESGYGSGPMARAIKEDLLPKADRESAEVLLTATLRALPHPEPGKRFKRFPETEQPERAWLLDVLPDCFARMLSLLPVGSVEFPEVCLDAAERIEAMRHSGFVNDEDMSVIHSLVADRSVLRWQIALEIAQSDEIRHATSRLAWGWGSLVSFGEVDLPALATRANDLGSSPETRNIWFEVGINIAFRHLKGRKRRQVLLQLSSGPESASRLQRLHALKSEWLAGLKQRRKWEGEDRPRKRQKQETLDGYKSGLVQNLDHIRDGSDLQRLRWLINYSFGHSGRDSLSRVNLNVISRDFGSAVAEAFATGLVCAWSRVVPPDPVGYPDGKIPWDAITGLAGLHVLSMRHADLATLSAVDADRAARLAVWEINTPPTWFERVLERHESVVLATLHPWLKAECASPSNERRRTLELALRSSSSVRGRLLAPIVSLVLENRIPSQETLKALLNALRRDGLLDASSVAKICKAEVEGSIGSEGLLSEMGWILVWIEEDPPGAWSWFECYVARLEARASNEVLKLAHALLQRQWLRDPASETNIPVLMRMYRALTAYLSVPDVPVSEIEDTALGHPVRRLREAILRILVQIPGAETNRALMDLAAEENDAITKEWLQARLLEHAGLEAQRLCAVEPMHLKIMSQPFDRDPTSEHELFQQVVGRLGEVKMAVEEGPFSDRLLFYPEIPEKHLQLWLAARFLDTTNRRFSVHREEVVDADNRTDIQLSCQYGNVCVEIKPLSACRSYSANSLAVETLRIQIVGQYLKGLNSSHGILVLLRLDEKKWAVPGKKKKEDFPALLAHLRNEAEKIKHDFPGIKELEVFGIDCVTPK